PKWQRHWPSWLAAALNISLILASLMAIRCVCVQMLMALLGIARVSWRTAVPEPICLHTGLAKQSRRLSFRRHARLWVPMVVSLLPAALPHHRLIKLSSTPGADAFTIGSAIFDGSF